MINSDTPPKVIGIRNGIQRIRIGTRPVKAGEMLYYIWHEPTGLYYIECYVNEAYAIQKAATMKGPSSMGDVRQSWRSQAKFCQHSYKTED